mgnify:CR=1 FL=1
MTRASGTAPTGPTSDARVTHVDFLVVGQAGQFVGQQVGLLCMLGGLLGNVVGHVAVGEGE